MYESSSCEPSIFRPRKKLLIPPSVIVVVNGALQNILPPQLTSVVHGVKTEAQPSPPHVTETAGQNEPEHVETATCSSMDSCFRSMAKLHEPVAFRFS